MVFLNFLNYFITLGALGISLVFLGDMLVAFAFALVAIALFGFSFITKTHFNGFHPFSYAIFGLFLKLCIPILLMMSWPNTPVDYNDVFLVSIFVILNVLFFTLGFLTPGSAVIAHAIPFAVFRHSNLDSVIKRLIFIYFLSVSFYVIGSLNGITHVPNAEIVESRFLSVMRDLMFFKTLAFICLAGSIFLRISRGKGNSLWFIFLLLLMFEVMLGLLEGGRSKIIEPVLLAFFVYSFVISPIPLFVLFQMACFALLFVAPALTIYKTAVFKNLLGSYAIDANLVVSSIRDMDLSPGNLVYNMQDVLFHFSGMLEGTVRTLQKVPDYLDFHLGSTFFSYLTVGWIPRILWEDKPVFLPGRYFAVQIFDHQSDHTEVGVSMGIGVFAESFLNFGYAGLLIVALFGFSLRVFYRRSLIYNEVEQQYVQLIRLFFLVFFVASGPQLTIGGYMIGGIRTWISYAVFLIVVSWSMPRLVSLRRPAE